MPQQTTTFLDIETTSLHFLRRRPWEIALIQRVTDGDAAPVDREILIQITGVDLADAEIEALEIGRFYQRHIEHRLDDDTHPAVWFAPAPPQPTMTLNHRDELRKHRSTVIALVDQIAEVSEPGTVIAVTEADAAAIVAHWTADTHVIGLNPEFDMLTLSLMLDRHGYHFQPWHYRLTNIATEAAGWLRAKVHFVLGFLASTAREHEKSTVDTIEATAVSLLAELTALPRHSGRLSELCEVAPPTEAEAHTALGDARWMRRWWDEITPMEVNR
ncbi:hypothetical protein ACWFPY_17640 [Nocardia fluminea]